MEWGAQYIDMEWGAQCIDMEWNVQYMDIAQRDICVYDNLAVLDTFLDSPEMVEVALLIRLLLSASWK